MTQILSKKRRNNMRKTRKQRKQIKQKGGVEMNLRQILISNPMIAAIKKYKPDTNVSIYTKVIGEQGFNLAKFTNFAKKTDPIILRPVSRAGKKINGVMKQLYDIRDGRHRVAYAICEGKATINATINLE